MKNEHYALMGKGATPSRVDATCPCHQPMGFNSSCPNLYKWPSVLFRDHLNPWVKAHHLLSPLGMLLHCHMLFFASSNHRHDPVWLKHQRAQAREIPVCLLIVFSLVGSLPPKFALQSFSEAVKPLWWGKCPWAYNYPNTPANQPMKAKTCVR